MHTSYPWFIHHIHHAYIISIIHSSCKHHIHHVYVISIIHSSSPSYIHHSHHAHKISIMHSSNISFIHHIYNAFIISIMHTTYPSSPPPHEYHRQQTSTQHRYKHTITTIIITITVAWSGPSFNNSEIIIWTLLNCVCLCVWVCVNTCLGYCVGGCVYACLRLCYCARVIRVITLPHSLTNTHIHTETHRKGYKLPLVGSMKFRVTRINVVYTFSDNNLWSSGFSCCFIWQIRIIRLKVIGIVKMIWVILGLVRLSEY